MADGDLFDQRIPWAHFSPCGRYRTSLGRVWNSRLPRALFVMMNPSTAGAEWEDGDNTVNGQIARVQKWNEAGLIIGDWRVPELGGIEVVNAHSYIETDSLKLPALVASGVDIVGEGNDQAILDGCRAAAIVICAWGKPVRGLPDRGKHVLNLIRSTGQTPYAIKLNNDRSPQHPLYLAHSLVPIPMPIEATISQNPVVLPCP